MNTYVVLINLKILIPTYIGLFNLTTLFAFSTPIRFFIDDMPVFETRIINAFLVSFRCVNQFKVNVFSNIFHSFSINRVIH